MVIPADMIFNDLGNIGQALKGYVNTKSQDKLDTLKSLDGILHPTKDKV